MEEINYNLEDKINLIYEYQYNLNSKDCYSINKIILGKIGLDDIKIPLPSDNQEEKEYWDKNKFDILNGKFKLISFNEKSYELLFKRYSNQFPANVKVSFYKDSKSINLMENTVNNDSLFSYILSQLVLTKKTKHILLPIINLDITYSDIESLIVNDISNSIIKTAILNNNISDKCCLQLREHFFKTINLEEYLLENSCSYKGLLFQIIHTLATIQKEFDGFRHNNLLVSNILIYLTKSFDTIIEYDGFKNDKFYLPNIGFDIKITNFEHSIIPKFYGTFSMKNPNIKFADQPNSYYDLYTFLNDLLEGTTKMSLHKGADKNNCNNETKKFLDKIIPPHIRGLNQNNFNKNMIIAKPVDLLYDSYFNEYRNKPSNNLVQDTIINHLYLTGQKEIRKPKFSTWMDSDNYSILGNQDKIISNYNIMNTKSNLQRNIKKEKLEDFTKLSRVSESYGTFSEKFKDFLENEPSQAKLDKLNSLSTTKNEPSSFESLDSKSRRLLNNFGKTKIVNEPSQAKLDKLNSLSTTKNEPSSFESLDSKSRRLLNNFGKTKIVNDPGNINKRIIKQFDLSKEKLNRINNNEMSGGNIEEPYYNNEMSGSNNEEPYYNNEMIGGSIDVLPYKSEKNTPFLSNDQRDTFKKRSSENPVREPPVILEQKIYDTSQKPAAKPQFPPTFIPLYNQEGQTMDHLLPYSNQVINQPPVQKVYNISLSNPIEGFTSINRIYEDVLPGNPFTLTSTTLFERKQLIDFLRNNILDYGDGEEMTAIGGKNSLLEYIKILDVNPYTTNKNPYLDLPRNFLIYRSGYPVRYDDKTKMINIGKPSMGLNVRMYRISIGDLRCKTINNFINADNFDLWREIKYYDWIKNTIVKNKISPNFISPILYKIDSKSRIEWDKLDMLREKGITIDSVKQLQQNQQKINNLHELDKKWGLFQGLIPLQFRHKLDATIDKKVKPDDKLKPEDKEDLTINSGKVLVLLTEAPTSSFIQWSSAIYETFGSVKKMISTGFHTADVWKSILFQLVYAFAVLQKKKIYFENFSLENNIFIKDVFSDVNSIGSWIYKVNSVDYYIPNYGYVLMIDSKYADIKILSSLIDLKPVDTDIKYKIYGSIFDENSNVDIQNLHSLILNQFKELIDPDNFNHNFRIKKGSIPPDDILVLLKNIHSDSLITTISDFIPKYFGEFVHNRIGTLLSKNEKENINILARPDFIQGNLMVWHKRHQEYEWVIYLGEVPNDGIRKKILTKNNNNYEEKNVFVSSLRSYPSNEKILPDSSNKMKFDEAHIYETYNLDNLS